MGMISYNMEYMLVAYLSYALTNSYAISAITVGTIFLVSRIFDGVSDVIAGVVIDRTNSKLGKARVYDLLHVPLWLCLVLLFSVPDIGTTGKVIWVFAFYNILQSGIATFMNIAEPLRLQRSFEENGRMKAMKVTSMGTMVFAFIGGMLLPILIKRFAGVPHGWTIISLIFAIPFAIFGIMRFILLPELEQNDVVEVKTEKVSISASLKALFQNKYALLYGGVMICWAMYNSFISGGVTYYFQYIYGDISAQSFMAIPTLVIVFLIALIPKLVDKFGKTNAVRYGLATVAVCQVAKLLMPQNVIWIVLMQGISTFGIMILSFMKPLLTIDCIAYGKLKTGNNVEAAYSTVNSLADKLGLGLGGFAMGAILELGKFDGTQAVQADSALFTIKMLYTAIPAAMMVIALVFLAFYNVEKKLKEANV